MVRGRGWGLLGRGFEFVVQWYSSWVVGYEMQNQLIQLLTVYCLLGKLTKIQNMMYHCSQLAKAIRGEQWRDALNLILKYNTK